MKKLVVALAMVFAVAVVFTGVAASSGDGGKLVASGFGCNVIDGNGNLFGTNNSEQWQYDNHTAVLRCTGDGAPYTGPNPPIFWTPANSFPGCNTLFGFTTDYYDKVGRKGNSQLVCVVTFANADSASGSGPGVG